MNNQGGDAAFLGKFFKMAESNMAATDRTENPDFGDYDTTFNCNTSNSTNIGMLSSFLLSINPFRVIFTFIFQNY